MRAHSRTPNPPPRSYVIFNILEIFDKLACSLGQDVMDGLYRTTRDGLLPAAGSGGSWQRALLPLAFVFDTADGAVARWRRRSSPYGADLDSLADIVSFGVAPAVVGFTLGLRGVWDTLILIYFVCCGISRLARFNVTAATLTDDATGKVRYFEGTPIPTSLFVVLVYFLAWKMGRTGEDELLGGTWTLAGGDLHPLGLLYLVSGSAMISERLRIPKL